MSLWTKVSPRRDYIQIKTLIQVSTLKESVKELSLKILERIAEAESKIHGCPKEKVHFHEVGGVDAIVDIVGTALGIDYLNIDTVVASKIPLGTGFTKSMHGVIPVPSPATLAILKGVPTYGAGIKSELVTPTGAAIITSLTEFFGPMPEMIVKQIGYGAGTCVLQSQPNLLRVVIGKMGEQKLSKISNLKEDDVLIIESAIDDMNPEIYGFLMEKLFGDGALDVCWIPLQMKKKPTGNPDSNPLPFGEKRRSDQNTSNGNHLHRGAFLSGSPVPASKGYGQGEDLLWRD